MFLLKKNFGWMAALCLPFLSACVSVEMSQVPMAGQTAGNGQSFPGVDGGTTITTLHFTVTGYNDNDMRSISGAGEDIYNKLGNDTGLYSFLSGQSYSLVIYKDHDEYMLKTKQPTWSQVVTVGIPDVHLFRAPSTRRRWP